MTIGEMYGDIHKIKSQAEFDAFFEKCVSYSMEKHGNTRGEAENYERSNIRFYAGHCNNYVLRITNEFLNREHDGYYRGFTRANKAWYAEANKITMPLIHFGIYSNDGGTTGEMTMEWIDLSGKIAPQLQSFNDSWKALASFYDVIESLRNVDGKDITDDEFVKILLDCGFIDHTNYTRGEENNDDN